jgi:hypothetical protein
MKLYSFQLMLRGRTKTGRSWSKTECRSTPVLDAPIRQDWSNACRHTLRTSTTPTQSSSIVRSAPSSQRGRGTSRRTSGHSTTPTLGSSCANYVSFKQSTRTISNVTPSWNTLRVPFEFWTTSSLLDSLFCIKPILSTYGYLIFFNAINWKFRRVEFKVRWALPRLRIISCLSNLVAKTQRTTVFAILASELR